MNEKDWDEEFRKLKNGDKLYRLQYWPSKPKRTVGTVTVKRVRGKTATLKGGYVWGVTKNDFGIDWFPSKQEMYEMALGNHECDVADAQWKLNEIEKEVRYLRKRIKIESKKK